MEYALYGFIGVIAGALVVKLYADWEDRQARKKMKALMDELDALYEDPKPPVSDPVRQPPNVN